MKLSTLSVFAAVAIATVSASPTLELRGGRPNGVSCRHDATCASSYCHHSKCDVKKKDGHACYKATGCVSGECNDGKCGKKPHPHPHPPPPPPPPNHHPDHPSPPGPPGPLPPPPRPSGPACFPGSQGPGCPAPPTSSSSTVSMTSTTSSPTPTQPVMPPTSGTLGISQGSTLLGEVTTANFGSGFNGVEVVNEAQVWSLTDSHNLVSPRGDILVTNGYKVSATSTPLSQLLGSGAYPFSCLPTSDSSASQAVLECTAYVAGSATSSFQLCQDGDGDGGNALASGAYVCPGTSVPIAHLTLTK